MYSILNASPLPRTKWLMYRTMFGCGEATEQLRLAQKHFALLFCTGLHVLVHSAVRHQVDVAKGAGPHPLHLGALLGSALMAIRTQHLTFIPMSCPK